MAEKKAPRQASIASFFSPQKPGEKPVDAFASPVASSKSTGASSAAPASASSTNSGTKRPRASPGKSTSPASSSKASRTKKSPPKQPRKPPKKKAATMKAKAKAKPKARAAPKLQKAIRTSPHAMVDGEDDDLDDDLDEDLDDEDVEMQEFNASTDVDIDTRAKSASPEKPTDPQSKEDKDKSSSSSSPSTEKAMASTTMPKPTTMDLSEGVEEATAAETIDLTDASTSLKSEESKTEEVKPKQTRRKTVRSLASTPGGKSPAKTPTKRQQQQQLKKEKAAAAAAAAAAAEAKAKTPEPLDPVTQARVDTYKLKMEELTRQYTQLQHSEDSSDAVMQEILGVAVDCGLEVTVDPSKSQQALADTWQKLREASHADASAAEATTLPSTVEFPHEVKSLLVKNVQGRSASLSALAGELLTSFQKDVAAAAVDTDKEAMQDRDKTLVDRAAALLVEMEIKMLAQRTAYGVRPAKANLFEDTSADALWVWEVGNLEKYFEDDAQKTVKRMRKHRKRLGQQLKTLARVVQLLHRKPVDEVKVSAEEAKVGKFGMVVEAELQRARDRERKEQEKLEAAEEKKRQEQERQQAREDEKRKRELESEAEKLQSTKRRKSLVSYFRSIDQSGTESTPSITPGNGTKNSAIDLAKAAEDHSNDVEMMVTSDKTMAQMDAVLGYLVSDKSVESAGAAASTEGLQRSIFKTLQEKRETTKKQTKVHAPQSWSSRRERDPKLGVLKLLQYHENHRPAYYGTFSKRSRLFRGGRRPFAQYPKFDYTVDSDDEWEEEEPGESLSGAESDGDESDEDNLDYGDQWLAYEDEVDYMDDADGDDVDGSLGDDVLDRGNTSSSPTKHKLPSQLQHKKRAKRKAVKPEKLEPVIVGPFWSAPSDGPEVGESHFPGCGGQQLSEPVFESTLMRRAREYELEQERLLVLQLEKDKQQQQQQQQQKDQQVRELKRVQEEQKAKVAAQVAAGPKQASILAAVEKMASPNAVKASSKPKTSTAAAVASTVPSSSPAKAEITAWFKRDGPSPAQAPDK